MSGSEICRIFLTFPASNLAFNDLFELGSIEQVSAVRFWLGSQRGLIAFSYAPIEVDGIWLRRNNVSLS